MTRKLKPLESQTIVITGATSGIGLTTARDAAAVGARVILVARDEKALREECEGMTRNGWRADFVAADVGKRDDVRRVVEIVEERHGGFDTWVNNAGVGIYAPLREITDEDHRKTFETNYWGVVHGTTEALRHLDRKGGAIINMGSISSDMPTPVLSAYAASKHAVKGFTDSLRQELIHDESPVSLTLIKPSGVHTPFGDHARNYFEMASQVPPPVYHPRVVAGAILHAAQHPTRDITVGESGAVQTSLAYHFPRLTDWLFSKIFYKTAFHAHQPARHEEALHEPGHTYGHRLGDQKTPIIRYSPYTEAQKYPGAVTAGVLLMLAAGAAVYVSSRRHA